MPGRTLNLKSGILQSELSFLNSVFLKPWFLLHVIVRVKGLGFIQAPVILALIRLG